MIFLQLLLIAVLTLIASIYLWLREKQNYWPKRNIPSEPDSIYFLGRSKHVAFYLRDIYKRFKDNSEPFVGVHLLFSPALLLFDLDLIKNVFIGDFESFPDRGFYHNTHDDPLSGNLVRLEGLPWKRMRTKLTPTFTSGKMKFMFPTVVTVAESFSELLNELLLSQQRVGGVELQIRDLCARFTTDVIGSVAFGIECNSLREPNTEFRLKGDKAFSSFRPVVEALGNRYPRLFRRLHVTAFPQELIDFYSKIVTENIEYREREKIRRNDFLDILIELKNTQVDGEADLTLEEVIGQAFVFFIAGFDTTSSTMSFCLYELSRNQDVQDEARKEIVDCLARNNNQLSYECLREMKYLEQVLLETLRKYPVAPVLKRVTRKNYRVPNTTHIIEPGVQAIIPVYAIHHNPDYFPEPDKFDPTRFSPEEVKTRHPMTYLPFGAGPRVCIAERFGKMQALTGLAMLVKNFRFTNSSRTPKVLDYDKQNFRILSVKDGIHLNVEKIR